MAEKFAVWDSPSGNAFRPPRFAPQGALMRFIVGPLLLVVRTPLLLLVACLYAAVRCVPSAVPRGCGPLGCVRRLWLRTVDVVFARALLFIIGFVWIGESAADLRRMGIGSARSRGTGGQAGSVAAVQRGDVVLCNHVSFVQVLYLAYRCSPEFTTVPLDGKGKLRRVGLFAALRAAFGADTASTTSGAGAALVSLDALAGENRALAGGAPVVVFPEGAPTNNTTMLRFEPIAGESGALVPETASRTHLLTFKFGGVVKKGKGRKAAAVASWSPVQPASPPCRLIVRALFQLTHALDVRFLRASLVPKADEHAAGVAGLAPGSLSLDAARELMASNGMLGRTLVETWKASDYVMFEAWERNGQRGEVPKYSR